jgi:hypothetical protein
VHLKSRALSTAFLLILCSGSTAYSQITPSDDAYTNTARPTKNFGTSALLESRMAQLEHDRREPTHLASAAH